MAAMRRIIAVLLGCVLCITAVAVFPAFQVAAAENELIFNMANGNIQVYSDRVEQIGQTTTYYTTEDIVITGSKLTGAGDGIEIKTSNPVILRDVTIELTHYTAVSVMDDATIWLEGTNRVTSGVSLSGSGGRAGIYVEMQFSLTICGDGSLTATGSSNSAGIGGNGDGGSAYGSCGTVTVESGTVTAVGSGTGPGIGTAGGWAGSGGTVIVNGGSVTANGGPSSNFAIGSHSASGDAGSLTVNGGTLEMGSTGFGPSSTGTFEVNGGSVSVQGQTAPTISSVSPATGPTAGGTDITLTGSAFTGVTSVKIGGAEVASLNVANGTTITCTTPAGTAGAADIVVFNPSAGADTRANGFTYIDIAVPVIAEQSGKTEIPHNGSLTLEVSNHSGYNAPTYQWYKDGTAISGATTHILTAAEAGTYKVEVTADSQTKDASIALTKVGEIAAPVIVSSGGTEIPHNGSLSLSVSNAGSYANPDYQWYKDGAAIVTNSDILTATEAGAYKVKVTVGGQSKESNEITLTKEAAPPPITDNPSAYIADSLNLDLNGTRTDTIRVSLGQSGTGTMAASAEAVSSNGNVATATPTRLNANGDVTVEAKSVGSASVTVIFYDAQGNVMPGSYGGPFAVSVVNSYQAPSSTSDRSSDRDSGGSRVDTYVKKPASTTLDAAAMRQLLETAKKNGWDFVRSSSSLPTTVKAEAWKLLSGYQFVARTVADNSVQVQLTFPEPNKITADMKVSGWVKGSVVDSRKAFFEKWFVSKLQVIHLEHTGSFGQPVEVAAKVDLTGMDTTNLYFYSYDKEANSYKRIENPDYWIDENGYLHFTTELAGDIIVSEGMLEKR